MTQIRTSPRKAERTAQTRKTAQKRGWTITKYAILTICGFAMFRVASAFALAERGYTAIGGETVFILLPLFYYILSALARDTRRDIKNFKEDIENETSL